MYCYQNGELINPGMTLKEMTEKVASIMKQMNFDPKIIDITIDNLPNLKRWRKKELAS